VEASLDAAAVEDAVEAAPPYNGEHVVPQSWFGNAEPMRGDLHRLFACETAATASAATLRAGSSPTPCPR
jgi:hypothetical protein